MVKTTRANFSDRVQVELIVGGRGQGERSGGRHEASQRDRTQKSRTARLTYDEDG